MENLEKLYNAVGYSINSVVTSGVPIVRTVKNS